MVETYTNKEAAMSAITVGSQVVYKGDPTPGEVLEIDGRLKRALVQWSLPVGLPANWVPLHALTPVK